MPSTTIEQRPGDRPSRGLTAIDLLVTMAALAIVILIAVPSSTTAIRKQQMNEAASNLLSGLSAARSESVARSSTVTVCPSSNGQTCRRDSNWNLGWLVFSDGNADGGAQEFERLEAFEAPSSNVQIYAWGAVTARASFTAAGLTADQGSGSGRFLVCLIDSDAEPRVVDILADGTVLSRPALGQHCTHEESVELASIETTAPRP
jgi:Tfp pilus assembly protein FimT